MRIQPWIQQPVSGKSLGIYWLNPHDISGEYVVHILKKPTLYRSQLGGIPISSIWFYKTPLFVNVLPLICIPVGTASATKSIRVSNDMSCRYFRGCNVVQDSKWIVVLVKTIVSNTICAFSSSSCTFVIFGNWTVSCCIQCGIWTVFIVLDNEWASEFLESVMYWMSILLALYVIFVCKDWKCFCSATLLINALFVSHFHPLFMDPSHFLSSQLPSQ